MEWLWDHSHRALKGKKYWWEKIPQHFEFDTFAITTFYGVNTINDTSLNFRIDFAHLHIYTKKSDVTVR
jgi:hypothetical protein